MGRLMGRAAELASVRTSLAEGASVLVIGDAGIGKTALVQTVLTEITHREGGALMAMANRRFFPLARALREQLAGDVDDVCARCRVLVGDAVLFVDDLQWADAGTLAVLDRLARIAPVVMTSRPGPHADEIDHHVPRIRLEPLDEHDSARLAKQLHPSLDDAARRTLVRVAAGYPLLLESLPTDAEVSPTMTAAVSARVALLPAPGRRALLKLALLGRPGEPEIVGDVAGDPYIVRVVDGRADLRHALVTEALLRSARATTLEALHLELGSVLTGVEAVTHLIAGGARQQAADVARQALPLAPIDDRAELLRLMAGIAGDPDEAAVEWVEAASALIDAGRFAEATAACEAAMCSTDHLVVAEAWFHRARAEWLVGDLDAARRSFDTAQAGAGAAEDPLTTRILVERAYLEIRTLERGGMAMAEVAHRAAVSAGVEVQRARAVLGAAMLYEMRPGWDDLLREVIEAATAEGDVDLACTATHHLVSGLGFLGRFEESIERCRQMVDWTAATRAGTWHPHFLCALLLFLSRMSRERSWVASTATSFLDEHAHFRNRGQAEAALVIALIDLDRVGEARQRAQLSWDAAGDEATALFAAIAVAESAWQANELDAVADIALESRRFGDLWWGIRSLVEVLGAYATTLTGGDYSADVPGFVIPASAPATIEIEAIQQWRAGEPRAALATFDRAAAAWRAVGPPRFALRAESAAAFLAGRVDDPSARRRHAAVEATAQQQDLVHLLRPWRRLGRFERLSSRQAQVLTLVGKGMTSIEIAARLGISPATVNTHVASARVTLGATTRREAAAG